MASVHESSARSNQFSEREHVPRRGQRRVAAERHRSAAMAASFFRDRESAVAALVACALERAGLERPPVDAVLVARRLGLDVHIDTSLSVRGRIVAKRTPVICVRDEPRPERVQWTVAHELGEYLLPGIAARIDTAGGSGSSTHYGAGGSGSSTHCAGGVPIDAAEREAIANRFASLLLVPPGWWEFDARVQGFDLLELKRLYATASHEVLASRMLDLEPPTMITVFDHGRFVRRTSNLHFQAPRLQPIERHCQRMSHMSGERREGNDPPLSVTAWPIHEVGWKREILRSVVDVEAFEDGS